MHELTLSQTEACRLTDEVKADAQRLWAKLLSLYEGRAHIALGYASWAEYCEQEFQMRKAHAYRLLKAAQILETTLTQSPMGDSLKVTSQVPESERLARELVPLLGNPQAIDEAWNEAVEQAGGVPTAQVVHEVVSRKLATTPLPEKKPLHDLEGIDPYLFKLATRAGERCASLLPDSQQVILLHAGNTECPNSACVLGESHHTTPVR